MSKTGFEPRIQRLSNRPKTCIIVNLVTYWNVAVSVNIGTSNLSGNPVNAEEVRLYFAFFRASVKLPTAEQVSLAAML
jgi:hypothetical protein